MIKEASINGGMLMLTILDLIAVVVAFVALVIPLKHIARIGHLQTDIAGAIQDAAQRSEASKLALYAALRDGKSYDVRSNQHNMFWVAPYLMAFFGGCFFLSLVLGAIESVTGYYGNSTLICAFVYFSFLGLLNAAAFSDLSKLELIKRDARIELMQLTQYER